jgi:two-component system chemotaxis response regulator CheY
MAAEPSSRRALVVDDSRAIRRIIGRTLDGLGFAVAEAADGREGLVRLGESDAEVVLVDWNMPEMGGLEFVRAVRADPGRADVRLVMVTSEAELGHMVEALEAGADEYLMKPFTPGALSDKLALLGLVDAADVPPAVT